jgi:predicted GNAT family N-acyltransferase
LIVDVTLWHSSHLIERSFFGRDITIRWLVASRKRTKIIMKLETIDLRTISAADARAIAELLVSIWPKPGRTVETRMTEMLGQFREYHGPESQHPRSFLVRENGRIIAHASALVRTIETSAGEMTVLALARVCTDPTVRGKKLGELVTRAAFELVDNGTFPFALFQTTEKVKPFYERFGAVQVENRFVNSKGDDPTASPFWDTVIMRYPGKANWPVGEIDTLGPGW